MIENVNLTHGIIVQGGEVYVSTQLEVLLYEFGAGVVGGEPTLTPTPKVIVNGLPGDGGTYIRPRWISDAGPCVTLAHIHFPLRAMDSIRLGDKKT